MPGIARASRRHSSGSSTLQALAKASASMDRSAITVAAATRSTGRPERGSKMCEYHRPPIRNPRCELPLVATDRSLTAIVQSGSDDSESAHGATTPIVPSIAPRVRRSPPTLSITPVTPGTSAIAASQARSTMKPLAIPLRLSGQSESRSAVLKHRVEPPGPIGHHRPGTSELVRVRQSVLPGAGRPEPREDFDPRIEGPAGSRLPVLRRPQDFEELGRDPRGCLGHRPATG